MKSYYKFFSQDDYHLEMMARIQQHIWYLKCSLEPDSAFYLIALEIH